jgi:putative endopeptidase
MAIALEALQTYLPTEGTEGTEGTKRTKGIKRKQMLRDFFTSYAVSWRSKERKEKAKQSLSTDVHAPAPLRVNLVVRQFAAFYEAFDLGPDDEGFIPEEKRIVLW